MSKPVCEKCGGELRVSTFLVGKAKGFTPFATCPKCRARRAQASMKGTVESIEFNSAVQKSLRGAKK